MPSIKPWRIRSLSTLVLVGRRRGHDHLRLDPVNQGADRRGSGVSFAGSAAAASTLPDESRKQRLARYARYRASEKGQARDAALQREPGTHRGLHRAWHEPRRERRDGIIAAFGSGRPSGSRLRNSRSACPSLPRRSVGGRSKMQRCRTTRLPRSRRSVRGASNQPMACAPEPRRCEAGRRLATRGTDPESERACWIGPADEPALTRRDILPRFSGSANVGGCSGGGHE